MHRLENRPYRRGLEAKKEKEEKKNKNEERKSISSNFFTRLDEENDGEKGRAERR